MSNIPKVSDEFRARVLSSCQKPFNEEENHWWYDNKIGITTVFHVLSAVFPEGEAFFVSRYIKDTENKSVIDSKLLRDASAFISQETHHSVEHRSYNRKIEELYNYPMEEKNVWVRTLLMEIENRHNGHLRALALTCSLEHITATLSELLLGTENGLYLLHRMSPSHRSIWIYHAIEEMEHKSVAYDVYEKVAHGSYFLRIFIHLLEMFLFFYGVIKDVMVYLYNNDELSFKNVGEVMYFAFIYPGLLIQAIPLLLAYCSPSFHPSKRDNTELVKLWSAKLEDDSREVQGKEKEKESSDTIKTM